MVANVTAPWRAPVQKKNALYSLLIVGLHALLFASANVAVQAVRALVQ